LGYLKDAVDRKTHIHTQKQELSAAVTGNSEHTLAGVVHTKDKFRYLWMLRVGSENVCA
jgi:hypothetical protein